MDFSRCTTAVCDSPSSVPLTSFPALSRTEYWNVVVAVAISQRLSGPAAEPVEVLDVVALLETGVVRDLSGLHELREGLVHRVHAVPATGLQGAVDLVRLAFADQVAACRRPGQNLGRGHAPL